VTRRERATPRRCGSAAVHGMWLVFGVLVVPPLLAACTEIKDRSASDAARRDAGTDAGRVPSDEVAGHSSAAGRTSQAAGRSGGGAGRSARPPNGAAGSGDGEWYCLPVGESCTCVEGLGMSGDLCGSPKPGCCFTLVVAGENSCTCWPDDSDTCKNQPDDDPDAKPISTCPPP
jgi:hypothetical protein